MENKERKKRLVLTEGQITALLLSLIGGFLESYSLYYRGFWGMMMTGNLVYMATSIVGGNFSKLLIYVPVILSFGAGIFLANWLEYKWPKRKYLQTELIIMLCLLAVVIAIPSVYQVADGSRSADAAAWKNIIANCLLSVIGAFLLESFHSFGSIDYAPTMMTANFRKLIVASFEHFIGNG